MRGKCFPGKLHAFFLRFQSSQALSVAMRSPVPQPRRGLAAHGFYLVGFFSSLLKRARVGPVFPPLLPCVHGAAFGEAFLVQSLPRGDGRHGCPMAAHSAARHPS